MSQVGEILDRKDRPAYVQFEYRPKKNNVRTLERGTPQFDDELFVMVTPLGSRDVHEAKYDVWIENQKRNVKLGKLPTEWYNHWVSRHDAFIQGHEMPLNGTPIKTWPAITPAQTKQCLAVGILTVEDLAAVNDEGLRRLGMGARKIVNLAKDWLQTASDTGKTAMEVNKLKSANESLTNQVESLTEKLNKVSAQLQKEQTNNHKEASKPVEAAKMDPSAFLPDDEPHTPSGHAQDSQGLEQHNATRELPIELEKLADDALKARYKTKYGKLPGNMKRETIIKKLKE